MRCISMFDASLGPTVTEHQNDVRTLKRTRFGGKCNVPESHTGLKC